MQSCWDGGGEGQGEKKRCEARDCQKHFKYLPCISLISCFLHSLVLLLLTQKAFDFVQHGMGGMKRSALEPF